MINSDKKEAEKFAHLNCRKITSAAKALTFSGFFISSTAFLFIMVCMLLFVFPSVSRAALVSEDVKPAASSPSVSTVPSPAVPSARRSGSPEARLKSKVLIKRGLAPAEKGAKRKTLRGTVGARNMNGMAVVFERDEAKRSSSEMWFPFGDETYLDQYDTLEDVQEGDEVSVTYDESEEGIVKLKGISLVRKAPAEVEQFDPEAEAEE